MIFGTERYAGGYTQFFLFIYFISLFLLKKYKFSSSFFFLYIEIIKPHDYTIFYLKKEYSCGAILGFSNF